MPDGSHNPSNEEERSRVRGSPRPTILVLTDHYLPGFRSGGPVRSISNIVESLSSDFRFRIMTRDRDMGAHSSYETASRCWQPVGAAHVRYLSPSELGPMMVKELRSVPYDVIYVNSFFSPMFTIVPLLLRRANVIPRVPLVVAPRGEFSSGALNIRTTKKRLWIRVATWLRLYDAALWQASNAPEADEIKRVFGPRVEVQIASDLVGPFSDRAAEPRTRMPKQPGSARVAFCSRISPMKNLEVALESVRGSSGGRVRFDIYGPREDPDYWRRCQGIIDRPRDPAIQIEYMGELSHEDVEPVLATYDLALFPTHGENFGHAIFEALSAGCPVAVSERTPWSEIEPSGAGWVIPSLDVSKWTATVDTVVAADEATIERLRGNALELARRRAGQPDDIERSRRLFATAVETGIEGRKSR